MCIAQQTIIGYNKFISADHLIYWFIKENVAVNAITNIKLIFFC